MNSIKAFFFVYALMQTVYSSSPKMVAYWGQNSAGSFTTAKDLQEKPLRTYCEDSTYDIIVVGFVYLFPGTSLNADATLPGMNFANHCEVPFNEANPYVLNCTANVAPDITYCQSRGKQILLSFGGGVGTYGFSSDAQAVTFAHTVWNMFLGGSANGVIRPFGNAVFDGVDLDIEGGSAVGYVSFINTLRTYFASSSRSYYISSAPQCFYPDRIGPGAGTPLTDGWFDYVWIQFYNNHCGIHNFGTSAFNWATWATQMKKNVNPNLKLFLGAPASSIAAASGYVELPVLQTIATAVAAANPEMYGGVMIWDISTSDLNNDFGPAMGRFVHSQGGFTPSTPVTPTPSPSVPSTTGRVIASSTTGRVASTPVAPTPVTPSSPVSPPVITVPTPAPSTPVAVPTPASNTASNNTACTVGYMKCLTTTTYSTCNWGAWGAAQSCGSGTVCNPAGNFVYCVASNTVISTPTSVPSTPVSPPVIATPVPSTPVSPPVVATPVPSTPVSVPTPSTSTSGSSSSVISTPSSNSASCVLGYQQCVGTTQYRTCGNGRNGPTWAAPQSCQAGLSCHASSTANNIYCY